jgi:polyisoprenoid-binding protein YceI
MSDKQALWWADAANSRLAFRLRHLVLSQISGVVRSWRASIRIDVDDPARSAVYAVIDAATLDTDDPSRDEQIRSSEFLDVATHPEIQFRSRRVSTVDLDTGGVVVGDKVEVEVTVNAVADTQGLMTKAIPLGSATVT